MKKYLYIFLVMLSLLLLSCEERIMNISELEIKDEFYYEKLFQKDILEKPFP